MSDPANYTVGWICAIMPELVAAQEFLDEEHEDLEDNDPNDSNAYTLGRMGKHNIAIATLPNGKYGLVSAATVANNMQRTFPNLRIGLMVGIGGGAPSKKNDIRLGDVVVSEPGNGTGGVFQYDYGKAIQGQGFLQTGFLNTPPDLLGIAVAKLRAFYQRKGHKINETISGVLTSNTRLKETYQRPDPSSDRLYRSEVVHSGEATDCAAICGDSEDRLIVRTERTKDQDNPAIHYGVIASANQLMKDAGIRDELANARNILCFEMEAAGLMNNFPCLVIRGICDYADSHKNKQWQGYAAMVAAAYAKGLLSRITPSQVEAEKKISEIISEIQDTVSTTAADVKMIKADVANKEDIEVLEWLTTINYGPKHSDVFSARQPGTGKWFLNSPQYQDWISSTHQATLFCPGMPGAGKTIIASVVIDDLKTRFGDDSQIGIAYIYCTYKGENAQRADLLLASLAKQLARRLPSLPTALKSLYDKHKRDKTRPSLEEIVTMLYSVAGSFSKVLIVLDALDEYRATDTSWTKFLVELRRLQEKSNTRILAISRPILEIEGIVKKFQGYTTLGIRAQKGDVLAYLENQMDQLPAFVAERSDLQQEIKTKIATAVDGMFLLAKLYLDSLKGKKSAKALREMLPGVGTADDLYNEAYENAMGRIHGQSKDETELAKEALSWIICAKRPLTTTELLHALAVEVGKSEFDKENLSHISQVVSVCAGLVMVDTESNIVRLVHYTTQEYFELTQSRWFPDAEYNITEKCITYLSFDTFEIGHSRSDEEFEERLKLKPLYHYAAKEWGHHARRIGSLEDTKIIDFLNSQTKVEASSQVLLTPSWSSQRFPRNMTGLHLAAYFGVGGGVVSQLLSTHDVDAKDSDNQTALIWAAESGHEAVVRLLLKNGAELESKDEYNRTALIWAAEKGHEAVVKLLLENSAELESKDEYNQTALIQAAKGGYEAVVRLLLKNGAELESEDRGYSRTALIWAAESGHKAVVKLLLENSAELESKDEYKQTALIRAAKNGHEAVVKLLLENGAKLESKDNYNQTALIWAAKSGYEAVVRLLLKNGAELESKDEYNQTALIWAAEKGHETVVKLLLENGAELESKDNYGRTALSWAAENGHKAVVKLLLENGAELELKDR